MVSSYFSGLLQSIEALDVQVNAMIALVRTPSLDIFFLWVTQLGSTVLCVSMVCVFLLLAVAYQKYAWILPTALVVTGAPTTTYMLKLYVARPRPEFGLISEPLYSFPSGHATAAMACFGFMCVLMVRCVHKSWQATALVLATCVVVICIGFSRLYLGVHYLSDVLMGFVVGAVWIGIGVYVLRKYGALRFVDALQGVQVRHVRRITWVLILLLGSVYVYLGVYHQPDLIVR